MAFFGVDNWLRVFVFPDGVLYGKKGLTLLGGVPGDLHKTHLAL